MDNHAGNVNGCFCKHLKIKLLSLVFDLQNASIGLNKFIEGRQCNLEVKRHHNLAFFFFDLSDWDFGMGYFVKNRLNTYRVNLFIFTGYEHTTDASLMNILDFEGFHGVVVKLIHQVNGIKECLLMTVITWHHLHNPVDHLST